MKKFLNKINRKHIQIGKYYVRFLVGKIEIHIFFNSTKDAQKMAELEYSLKQDKIKPFLNQEKKDELIEEYKLLNGKYDWYFHGTN